ncbi:spore cortex peptidoglycan biosynthesis regulator SpoVE [Natribacillus halophilus]|uniref:Spore cortex peptidoglycan biosynthesis regulator SpoVE n=2 Tax=Natribacillus halophilus TaxID=549003 RepID=A0A1G8MGE7_9BACI|nr:spore cortex peptidoglycan biosynthesis regulator SpoVE [Natribacillus halophilus]
MVYSASAAWGEYRFSDPYHFAKRQLLFAGAGCIGMLMMMRIGYWRWRDYVLTIILLCFGLLILVLIPGVGLIRGGAQSWIGVGAFSIQPSEFMKLGMIVFLAHWLAARQQQVTSFRAGMLPLLTIIFTAFGLIMLQPDLGTGAVMVATSFIMLFIAGAKKSHFAFLGAIGAVAFIGLIASAPYRIARITSFFDPWSDPLGSGFQIIQSLYAIGPGGLFGMGFGESRQKYFYLPEPQTDFIFAVIAEEGGFIAGAVVVLLFGIIMWRGLRTALLAPDMFGTLLAVGIIGLLFVQVLINIGVVIGLFPVTGITLPLLSYGGSSLTLMLIALGILLNISAHTRIT